MTSSSSDTPAQAPDFEQAFDQSGFVPGVVIGIGDPETIMASKEVREIYLGMEV